MEGSINANFFDSYKGLEPYGTINKTQAMDFYLFDVWYVNNLPLDNTGVYMYTYNDKLRSS